MRIKLFRAYIIVITGLAIASVLTICAVAQGVDDPPMPTSGLHSLSLQRADAPEIHYSILIPRGYSPSKTVPLVLALHFAVGGGTAAGAGRDLIQILVAPALTETRGHHHRAGFSARRLEQP
jgi:hypothetical protein